MKTSNSLLLAGGVSLGVYYFFPQIKQVLVSSGKSGGSSGGVAEVKTTKQGQIVDNTLNKKQLKFIGNQLDNSQGTSITTTSINGYGRSTIITDLINSSIIETPRTFKELGRTDTVFLYKNKGSIVGGSDFGQMQSLTKKAAQNYNKTKTNPIITITRSSSHHSSSRKKKSTNGHSKKSISKAKSKIKRDYENKNKVSTTLTKKQISAFHYLTGGF